jgi:hypothetical protein
MKSQCKKKTPIGLAVVALLLVGCSQPRATSTVVPTAAAPRIAPTLVPIHPLFDQSTLAIGDQVMQASKVISPWQYAHSVDSRRFVVQGNTVSELGIRTDENLWSIESPHASALRWLDADGQVAYLTYDGGTTEQSSSILRLDLNTHEWLSPLEIPARGLFAEHDESVIAVLSDMPYLIALSLIADDESVVSYRVTCYDQDSQEMAWTRTFEWAGERAEPGAYLMAAREPDYAVSHFEPLATMGNYVLVCAGDKQDIISLDRATGREAWRVERIWEYERGFMGPSVWSHYISRFGLDQPGGPDEQQLTQAQEEFDERFECAIVGGPVVVPYSTESTGDDYCEYSVFVAVAKGPKGSWAGYLSQCVVYELRAFYHRTEPTYSDVHVLSMATVPRIINGWQYQRVSNGVVWAGQGNSMVKFAPTPIAVYDALPSMGGGSPDLIANIEWYHQFTPAQQEAWLSADPASDPVDFTSAHAFRPLSGGYITSQSSQVYHFPIAMINLETGVAQTLLLNVPYRGEVPPPETNYKRSGDHIETFGPYLLGVTWLEVRGTMLRITLGTRETSTTVDFDLAAIIGSKE